jgi:hypothetical protein
MSELYVAKLPNWGATRWRLHPYFAAAYPGGYHEFRRAVEAQLLDAAGGFATSAPSPRDVIRGEIADTLIRFIPDDTLLFCEGDPLRLEGLRRKPRMTFDPCWIWIAQVDNFNDLPEPMPAAREPAHG